MATTRKSSARSKVARPAFAHELPRLTYATVEAKQKKRPPWKVTRCAEPPAPRQTLCLDGPSAVVEADDDMPGALLRLPFTARALPGIDPASMRVFRADPRRGLVPVWTSGVNVGGGFAWANIRRPGAYVAIGLPQDRLVQAVLELIAVQRRYLDPDDTEARRAVAAEAWRLFTDSDPKELQWLRHALATIDIVDGGARPLPSAMRMTNGGHIAPFDLPGGRDLESFRKGLRTLDAEATLAEEHLFFRPELGGTGTPYMFTMGGGFDGGDFGGGFPGGGPRDGGLPDGLPNGWEPGDDICPPFPWWKRIPWPFPIEWPRPIFWPRPFPIPIPLPIPLCRLRSQNWPTYHHDAQHSGVASGCSDITSYTASTLIRETPFTLEGDVVSIPLIVNGHAYVGTANRAGTFGGAVYRINLTTRTTQRYDVERRNPGYFQGCGGSLTVTGNRLYGTAVPGWVFCLDATSLVELWRCDLRNAGSTRNQPVNNNLGSGYKADTWASPLVVNGRVYVGCGEGEDPDTYGFVYCLDAITGNVIWLFCTCKGAGPGDNQPNQIPRRLAISDPLPAWALAAGFTIVDDPPESGNSVWSSVGYNAALNRVYVGTGNSQYDDSWQDTDQPDELYGSGLIALDGTTGQFRGFHQPLRSDCYFPNDEDIDVCGSITAWTLDGRAVVGYGSKCGSYFILDADTLAVIARRQMLPRDAITGGPLSQVAPAGETHGENQYGIYGTAAVHLPTGKVFIGLGGRYAIDHTSTPFVRCVDMRSPALTDAWPTAIETNAHGEPVRRYLNGRPPLYATPSEVGVSSPAIVNDLVFVTTTHGIYAFDVAGGDDKWGATLGGGYCLGAAISGNRVVCGHGSTLSVFRLP